MPMIEKLQSMTSGHPVRLISAKPGRAMGWGILAVFASGASAVGQALPANASGAPSTSTAVVAEPDQYRLAAGDQVAIVYPFNPELNIEAPVGPDGRLTLPLAGAVPVAGLTSTEAEARIVAALRRSNVVEDARPSLSVRAYGASVYVGGEVRNPGAVRLNGPLDVMRAIIMAGGVLDTARSKRVVIIRQGADGRPSLTYANLRDYVKNGGVGQDVPLRAQDVVFVPRSSIAEADLWIEQHINRVLPFSRSVNYNVGDLATRAVTTP